VKDVAVKLAGISKLENALANLGSRTVNLIEEEDTRLFTSSLEPIGGIEGGAVTLDNRKTNEVTLSHLRGSALNYGEFHNVGSLIDNLGLADAVATSKKDGLTDSKDVGDNGTKGLKINRHIYLSKRGFFLSTNLHIDYIITSGKSQPKSTFIFTFFM